jgi:hypothetical protein
LPLRKHDRQTCQGFDVCRGSWLGQRLRTASDAIADNHIFRAKKAISICSGTTNADASR